MGTREEREERGRGVREGGGKRAQGGGGGREKKGKRQSREREKKEERRERKGSLVFTGFSIHESIFSAF